jgi:two-component system, OmpR family, response regulator ResD
MARIILCEDDFSLRLSLSASLAGAGHDVTACASAEEAAAAAAAAPPELVVLDWNLPGIDGATLLRRWRDERKSFAVIMLSARDQVAHRIEGLEAGADDYLVKPFATEELLARIAVQLRRRGATTPAPLAPFALGRRRVDLKTRQVTLGSERVSLTSQEAELLAYLYAHRSRAVPREELLREVWGYRNGAVRSRAVDNAVYRLRAKLEDDPAAPRHLLLEHGQGYRFEP